MAKTTSKSLSLSNSLQKSPFFAALRMHTLHVHTRYFKFKQKYQQYGPCIQTIFPFLMTMILCINRYAFLYHVFLFVSFPHASKGYTIYKITFDIYGNRYEIAQRYFIQKRAKLFTQKYYTTVTYNLALRKKSSFPLRIYSVNVTQ